MELYINKYRCSLFKDEEIELTSSWGVDNMITGYGTYSKSFTIPCDSVNNNILSNFYIIGSLSIDPNYFIDSSVIVNGYEILGNLQVLGFQYKNNVPYSYNVVFYGSEKNLKKELDNLKMNSIDLTYLDFTFTKDNVVDSWDWNLEPNFFVPIWATKRALNWKDYSGDSGNINFTYASTTQGVTMKDLSVLYLFKNILIYSFFQKNISFIHSTKVNNFLSELFLMSGTDTQTYNNLTNINCQFFDTYTRTYDSHNYNKFKLYPSLDPVSATGILPGNNDTVSWHNINSYTTSNNYYTIPMSGKYNFHFEYYDIDGGSSDLKLSYINLTIINYSTDTIYHSGNYSSFNDITIILEDMLVGTQIQFITNAIYTLRGTEILGLIEGSCRLKIGITNTLTYNYKKSDIIFPDMFVYDFFTNFCKSFNIFYLYDNETRRVYTYFKDELTTNTLDLNYYMISTTITNSVEPKYKLIDYKFNEGKDINNIVYKKENGQYYGQFYNIYNYDLGKEKLEYKSIFTTIPRTLLNATDVNNVKTYTTELPLHSELSEELVPINTDFLLVYRLEPSGVTDRYSLQNSTTTFTAMTSISNWDSKDVTGTYDLNYNSGLINFSYNNRLRFETELEFLLPYNILYNLKVYDTVIVNGIYYEIKEFTRNLSTGKTKIKLITQ